MLTSLMPYYAVCFFISSAGSVTVYTSEYEITKSLQGPKIWEDAIAGCSGIDGSLLIIDSPSKTDAVIARKAEVPERCWIGAYKPFGKNTPWSWIDGEPIDTGKWAPGEPSNDGTNLNCVIMDTSTGNWSDERCALEFCFICQKRMKTDYVIGDHRVTYYRKEIDQKGFLNAEEICRRNDTRLIEVTDKTISDEIIKRIKTLNAEYFIGAKYSNNNWSWSSGKRIEYFNWTNDELQTPNESSCIVLKSVGWDVTDCLEPANFICESVLPNNIILSSPTLRIVTDKKYEVLCKADGYPTPWIEWFKGVTSVSRNNNISVFQIPGDGIATLTISKPSFQDEGQYMCVATNNASFTAEESKDEANFTLCVPHRAIILSLRVDNCTPDIVIYWIPNATALEIPHELSYNSSNQRIKKGKISIKNLILWKNYTISIYSRLNSKCEYLCNDTIVLETNERNLTNRTECLFEWTEPQNTYRQEINGNETVSAKMGNISVDISTIQYIVQVRPNRTIQIGIQSGTSVYSNEIILSRECTPEGTGYTSMTLGIALGSSGVVVISTITAVIVRHKQKGNK